MGVGQYGIQFFGLPRGLRFDIDQSTADGKASHEPFRRRPSGNLTGNLGKAGVNLGVHPPILPNGGSEAEDCVALAASHAYDMILEMPKHVGGRERYMTILAPLVDAGMAIAALLSGVFWMRAAYAKVASSGNVGVGYGGSPVNVIDHSGAVLDFLQSYTLQSKWNSRAAVTSGIAGFLGAISAALKWLS
jgi:hypothetical protein